MLKENNKLGVLGEEQTSRRGRKMNRIELNQGGHFHKGQVKEFQKIEN